VGHRRLIECHLTLSVQICPHGCSQEGRPQGPSSDSVDSPPLRHARQWFSVAQSFSEEADPYRPPPHIEGSPFST